MTTPKQNEQLAESSATVSSGLLSAALEATGFVICEFPADDDKCEKCNKPNLHHYFRRTDYESNDGEYFCAECVIKMHATIIAYTEEFSR
jgi:hypothetical protein